MASAVEEPLNRLFLYVVESLVAILFCFLKHPMSDGYRPHFVIYPLCKEDVKTSFDCPIVLNEYYSRTAKGRTESFAVC